MITERKRIQLFTPDEIMEYGEEFGFTYEPNNKLCTIGKCKVYWGCVDIMNGKIEGPYVPQFDVDWFTEEDFKRTIAASMHRKFINQIFVWDLRECAEIFMTSTYGKECCTHLDERVWYSAHTNKSIDEMYEMDNLMLRERLYDQYGNRLKDICNKYRK